MEIDLTTLGFLSSATTAFLNNSDNLTQLIPADHPFFSVENSIKGKEKFSLKNREILVQCLKKQYLKLKINDNATINRHIESLLEPETYTVTTGQQLHLFLGPAFMVYKLISTIKAAEYYQTLYPDKKFVPVYWLASEDHDFEEIKNTPLFGQNYAWQTEQTGACGTYHLKDLPPVFEQLKLKLASDSKALQLISVFEGIYNTSENLSDATIRLTHHLFSQFGLLCLDANNHALKTLFKPVIEKELFERKSELAFNDFSQKISHKGLSLQLKSRDINLFYLKDHIRGRIAFLDGNFSVVGTDISFTEEGMKNEIDNHPERFSPNAVLRPIYQETILPNIAYIAGNAEINYWLQLKEIFEFYHISPAKILLRQSAWFIKQKQLEWLKSKDISITDLFSLKTEQDNLRALSKPEDFNPFSSILSKFNELTAEMLDLAGKDGLKNIKQISDQAKQYEKTLKELVRAKNELLTEKNKKDIMKLEQILNSGFSTKTIQERTVYTLEFLISMDNYINYGFKNLPFNPGAGYFLPF